MKKLLAVLSTLLLAACATVNPNKPQVLFMESMKLTLTQDECKNEAVLAYKTLLMDIDTAVTPLKAGKVEPVGTKPDGYTAELCWGMIKESETPRIFIIDEQGSMGGVNLKDLTKEPGPQAKWGDGVVVGIRG